MKASVQSAHDLGALVKRIRTHHGLTQRELASKLGTSQRYVYELEVGKPKLADERYFTLLAALGISLTAESDDA